jgi:hypothetical protein
MTPDFNIQQIADAARLTRYQVEAWISRGHFTPENPVENGKARKFTADDAVVLAALAEFNRLGLAPTTVSMHTTQLRFRAGRGSLFVITSIMRQAGNSGDEIDLTAGDIIEGADLGGIASDPQVRSFAAVNIQQIEQRVRASLGID